MKQFNYGLINFDKIKIGDTISSDVYKRPAKCIYRTDNRVYFYGTHPVDSNLVIIYWYEKQSNENIIFDRTSVVITNNNKLSELIPYIKDNSIRHWYSLELEKPVSYIYLIKEEAKKQLWK